MSDDVIYPQPVIEVCERIYEVVFNDEYWEENEIKDVVLGRECAMRHLGILFLKKFVEGSELKFSSEDEVGDLLTDVNTEVLLLGMQKKGIIDSLYVPDKDDTVFFLTEKGKVIAEALKENEKMRPDVEPIQEK